MRALFLLAMGVFSVAAAGAVPHTMRAAAFDKAGGPEVLSIHELPVPSPGGTDVLIAVHGAGVAVWEADMRQHAARRAPFPIVLGSDGAGTPSTDEGLALARQLGADAVVNGRTGDIGAAAKRFAPLGVDAVLGLAGGDGLEHCIDALRPGQGRVAYMYGLEPIPRPRGDMRMILYSFVGGTGELERLNKAVEAAKLRVPVAAQYSLADAAAAHRRLEAGHLLGKIVLLATGESR